MLHCLNVSPIYVAFFDVALFTVALSNVALCKCCTILCSTILIFYHLILNCFHAAFLILHYSTFHHIKVALCDIALFTVALF